MRHFLKIAALFLGILYPFLIFFMLKFFKASPRVLVLVLLAIGTVYFLSHTDDAKGSGFNRFRFWMMAIIVASLGILTWLSENSGYIKLYPFLINLVLLASFSYTLVHEPSMIFRFASLQDKSILDSPDKNRIESYCRKVTWVWICFFILNGSMAFYTAFFANSRIWTFYNGFISYICIGLILLMEWIVRKWKIKK